MACLLLTTINSYFSAGTFCLYILHTNILYIYFLDSTLEVNTLPLYSNLKHTWKNYVLSYIILSKYEWTLKI